LWRRCSGDPLPHGAPRPSAQLERNRDGDWVVRVIAVIQIVPIPGVVKIHIVGLVPVLPPAFRPRIDNRDPVSVILEARLSSDKDQGKAVDAEEVVMPEKEPEAAVGNPVAVIAAALAPALVFVLPRTGARLPKACVHLLLMLRNSAEVNPAVGRTVELHASVIGAAIGWLVLLRSSLALPLSAAWLLTSLLELLRLRMLRLLRGPRLLLLRCLLRGPSRLGLRRLPRLALAVPMLIMLGGGDGCGSEE